MKIGDLDVGQGSTVDWHKDRVSSSIEPDIAVQLHRGPKEALAQANGVDLLVLDGPARADKDTLEIARLSDLVVLPTGASLDDLRPAVRTANSLRKAGIPTSRLLFVLALQLLLPIKAINACGLRVKGENVGQAAGEQVSAAPTRGGLFRLANAPRWDAQL